MVYPRFRLQNAPIVVRCIATTTSVWNAAIIVVVR